MGNMRPDMKYMMYNEMRRRDGRGRYMEGDMRQQRMTYGNYSPRNGNDTMRYDRRSHQDDVGRDRPDYDLTDRMSGEGYFVWDGEPEWESTGGNITDMRQYYPGMTMGGGRQEKMKIGFAQSSGGNDGCLTREIAERWVHSMQPADKNCKSGGKWTYEDAKQLAEEHGIPTHGQEMIDFFATINMMYSDYCKVARDHKVATEDYFVDLALAFLYDPDGVEPSEKIYNHYMYLVEHKNNRF